MKHIIKKNTDIVYPYNPWHKKERNSQAKEQTDHNGGKTRKTHSTKNGQYSHTIAHW